MSTAILHRYRDSSQTVPLAQQADQFKFIPYTEDLAILDAMVVAREIADDQWSGRRIILEKYSLVTRPPSKRAMKVIVDTHRNEWFFRRAQRWKAETAALSSPFQKMKHPAMKAILRTPKEIVLPLILREFQREPSHWFVALKQLTGEDPVPASERGNISKMQKRWVNWGRTHGFIE